MTDDSADTRDGTMFHPRRLSIIVFSLFFSWMLAFPFEGRILYALAEYHRISAHPFVFGAIISHFAGLLLSGFLIRTVKRAKILMLFSISFCILVSFVFFSPPSLLWTIALLIASFLVGGCVAAWGFYLRMGTPKNERIKTIADCLICSNIIMILLNTLATHISAHAGLGLSILMLGLAFIFAFKLSDRDESSDSAAYKHRKHDPGIARPFAFLCLFIVVITINSGLMYQVQGPAFIHLEWLTSWYWAVPYIAALFIMKNLPAGLNRAYILYIAIAMIGFSFIAFMLLDHSVISYLVVNTLMLGACGVYDLFWWSILGEMLDLSKNPVKVLGIGLSANVLGVLLGGLIGNTIITADMQSPVPTLLALSVVCVTLVMLPPLHKRLSVLLKNHAYLTMLSEMVPDDHCRTIDSIAGIGQLTEREKEIIALLFKGMTYRMIAGQLHVSENTVKTHVKNIYSKFNVQSRSELIHFMMNNRFTGCS